MTSITAREYMALTPEQRKSYEAYIKAINSAKAKAARA